MKSPKIFSLGDRGVVVEFDAEPSSELTALLAGLAEAARSMHGVIDAAPGHRTCLVETAPRDQAATIVRLRDLAVTAKPIVGNLHTVSINYDGPDLEWVCEHAGLSLEELIRLHSDRTYDVRLIGSPGFIYLSEVAPGIAAPRLETPRGLVPEGSVGIGGRQTGIYGRSRPGGWRLIGHVASVPEVRPGDRIRFEPPPLK